MYKKTLCVFMALVISLIWALPSDAATIEELKKQMAETQAQLNALNGEASGLEGQKDAIDEEISELDSNLMDLMSSISLLEEEIEQKKEEIRQAEEDLQAAEEEEARQYDAMKKRIKFMYEKGDVTYAQLLFEARSFEDMMNKADYIEKIYEYDRKMLDEYQAAVERVKELREILEREKEDLEEQEEGLKEEQAELEVLLDEKKAESKNFDVQIAQIRQSAAQYSALIKQQNAQIKQLEAEEAARRAAEEAKKKQSSTTSKSSGVAPANAIAMINSASGSAKGKEIAAYACKFIGNPYVAGGTSLTNGADCSGFTQAVYRDFGISIPRNSTAQRSCGTGVSYADAQPGDLICYSGHVGMYIGNGYIVHASTQKTGIKITAATYREILAVRRVL